MAAPLVRRRAGWLWLATAVGVVAVLMRSWSWFVLPPLEYEDGTQIFAHFYVHRDLAEVLRFKSGYLPLPQNLMGWLSARVDPRWAPYLLTWLPLALTAWVYAVFASAACRSLVRDGRLRCLLPLLLMLAPIGQIHLLANTDYSINHCALLVLASTCIWPMRLSAITWTVVNLFVWTHPLTSLAAPWLFWDAWRHPHRDRVPRLLTAINCVVHGLLGVQSGSAAALPGMPAESSLTLASAWSALGTVPRFLAHSMNWSTLGPGPTEYLAADMPWLGAAWASLCFVLVGIAMFRRGRRRRGTVRTLLLLGAWALVTLASRGTEYVLEMRQFRYWFPASLLCLALWIGVLSELLPARFRRYLGVLAVLWYAAMNFGPIPFYAPCYPTNGAMVRDMVRDLAEHERATGTWRGIRVVAPKVGEWPIEIDTR